MCGREGRTLEDYFEMTAFFPDGNRRWLSYVTAHIYFEDLSEVARALGDEASALEPNTYFIRKAFCMLTSRVPPSIELNKLNVFLHQASIKGQMVERFETYVAHLLFKLPCPDREKPSTTLVYIPTTNKMLEFSEPSVNELPSLAAGAIRTLFKKLNIYQVLKVLNLILHHSIIRVVGDDRNEVFLSCEALLHLVFPFKPVPRHNHTMAYIPLLSLRDYDKGDCP